MEQHKRSLLSWCSSSLRLRNFNCCCLGNGPIVGPTHYCSKLTAPKGEVAVVYPYFFYPRILVAYYGQLRPSYTACPIPNPSLSLSASGNALSSSAPCHCTLGTATIQANLHIRQYMCTPDFKMPLNYSTVWKQEIELRL